MAEARPGCSHRRHGIIVEIKKLLYLKCLEQFLIHSKYLLGISNYFGTSRVSLRSRPPGSSQLEWMRLIPSVTSISLKLPKAVAARISTRSFPQRVENGQREREWISVRAEQVLTSLPLCHSPLMWFWTAWFFHLSNAELPHIWNGHNNTYFVEYFNEIRCFLSI